MRNLLGLQVFAVLIAQVPQVGHKTTACCHQEPVLWVELGVQGLPLPLRVLIGLLKVHTELWVMLKRLYALLVHGDLAVVEAWNHAQRLSSHHAIHLV